MAHLEIRKLHKRFGQFTALDQVDLQVDKGEFLVLLGPSGCGKTTLLRTIAGLETQDNGDIIHAGRDISRLPPAQRNYGIVFQSYALFPNLTVAENVAYGLKSLKHDRHLIHERVSQMLTLVGLPISQEKYPSQLSGGQQQRVALARALATSPDLLFLDEPLSALDAIERVRLRTEIRNLQTRLGVTTIMVTHDQEEALSMADRVVVMESGRIQQIGSPRSIYGQPRNSFVADFIGRANIFTASVRDEQHLETHGLQLSFAGTGAQVGKTGSFYIRPEDIRLLETLDRSNNSFYAHVLKTEFLGAYSLVTLRPEGCPELSLVAQFATNYLNGKRIEPGAILRVGLPQDRLMAMPEAA